MKPVCLTIAGSDSGGGAGIQADIKSMEANGVYAATVITAVTAQNTVSVERAFDLPLDIIGAQIDAVASDLPIKAVKTGMLSSSAIIRLVAQKIEQYELHPLVVDPVMISKSGFHLLAGDAVEVLIRELLPLTDVVTPNVREAERLSGISVKTIDAAREAARAIHRMGPRNVIVKGGHLEGEEAVDVLFDGDGYRLFRSRKLETGNTHGTGCTYGSAIAAHLARGKTLVDAVAAAKSYVTEAIRNGLSIGSGHGPTDHFYFFDDDPPV